MYVITEFDSSIKITTNMQIQYSLEQLLAFQYVAEDLSFKKAAERLHLTPTALSHRIKKLELALELKLFERRTRKIILTAEGEFLLKHVQAGFVQIQQAIDHLQAHKQRLFTITTIPTYATEWLIPYLPDLQRLYPEVMFRVHASYDVVNMHTGQYDLAIRYGMGGYQDLRSSLLAKDEYIAVCHPFLLKEPVKWDAVPLIHFSWGDEYCPKRINWQKWYQQQDLHIDSSQRQVFYNEEGHAIRAVLAGQGVALLSKVAVAHYLKNGSLVQVSPLGLEALDYYFVSLLNVDKLTLDIEAWCREKLLKTLDR
ncbi:LysR substrate-binding domain-containing protein [Acinetobacter sp. TGL-Y2]|uniref:LysR substrate-binding domain-containing protein n=1 Tax=Acinetobacter sp. TGL-Y2 TaxID=1407071 RepID=UPI001D17BA9E|nr:LysR substrate-binding domain-containing protein [Acinetobacter sp. TGL-Y2]